MFTLTQDQQNAFTKAMEFIERQPNEPVFVIKSAAGCGKTFLAKYIVKEILKQNKSVVGVAPTHKARNILSNFINDGEIQIPTITVASLLGMIRDHSYIGTRRFEKLGVDKFEIGEIFIIDEISMVDDKSLEKIISYLVSLNKKAILIGDNYQIPSPSQDLAYTSSGCYCFKRDSAAFKIQNCVTLNTIVRQEEGSEILKLATYFRDNITSEIETPADLKISKFQAYDEFADDWMKSKSTKFIAYTNLTVKEHNENIRRRLNFNSQRFNVGENIFGYKNVGYPKFIIENGRDYIIESVNYVDNFSIEKFKNIRGHVLKLDKSPAKLFFIDMRTECCSPVLNELIARAQLVNAKKSTKDCWRKYNMLASKILFIDNIYKYNGMIFEELELKKTFPLLFTQTSKLINNGSILDNELANQIQLMFPSLLRDRLSDNKPISDNEFLSDKFMVLEKTADYGYALTAHKSQHLKMFMLMLAILINFVIRGI
jgi:hypothetical protein